MTTATKYSAAHRRSDCAKLGKRIGVLERRGAALREGHPDIAATFRVDAAELRRVMVHARRGALADAYDVAYNLDTAVRDEIPVRLYRALENTV